MRTTYELVRDHYAASDRGDLDGMLADIADDCRWTEMDGFPCAGTHVGRQAIMEGVFMPMGTWFDGFTFKLERLLDAGDRAVALGNYIATSKATGKSMNVRVVHVWGASSGQIRSFEQFTDTLRVAEAMK